MSETVEILEDTTTWSVAPEAIYGNEDYLVVSNFSVDGERRYGDAYIKFRVPEFEIKSAKLHLFCFHDHYANSRRRVALYAVDPGDWSESGTSWANAPAGVYLKTFDLGVATGEQLEEDIELVMDITDYVKNAAGKMVSFRLKADPREGEDLNLWFRSREAEKNQPYVEVVKESEVPGGFEKIIGCLFPRLTGRSLTPWLEFGPFPRLTCLLE